MSADDLQQRLQRRVMLHLLRPRPWDHPVHVNSALAFDLRTPPPEPADLPADLDDEGRTAPWQVELDYACWGVSADEVASKEAKELKELEIAYIQQSVLMSNFDLDANQLPSSPPATAVCTKAIRSLRFAPGLFCTAKKFAPAIRRRLPRKSLKQLYLMEIKPLKNEFAFRTGPFIVPRMLLGDPFAKAQYESEEQRLIELLNPITESYRRRGLAFD